jgi:excisionase family DNA binding protein
MKAITDSAFVGYDLSMQTEAGDIVLSLHQAAERLGVSHRTLRAQAHKGVLRATRISERFYVVTEQEVERYRREHLGKPGPKPKRPPSSMQQADQ